MEWVCTREQVVPRLVDLACDTKEIIRWRAQATAGSSGRVDGVGFGSGLNLGHSPPDGDVMLAKEPAASARRMAERRIRGAPTTVQHVGLDGQQIPLEDAPAATGPLAWPPSPRPPPEIEAFRTSGFRPHEIPGCVQPTKESRP